jgi:hypothetical protein
MTTVVTQTLRIFRKDFDYLRIEVAVFVLLAAAFAWTKIHIRNDDWSEPLLALAAAYLAARAVHTDGIPGDRQFWLTRPYSRASLIAAKLLFVLVCISLPVAIAELMIARTAGFHLSEIVPPLLLSQLVLFVFGALPIVALAALTTGIVPFILVALTLALLSIGGSSALEYWLPSYADAVPGPVQWIRSTLFAVPIAVMTVIVLRWQYRSRATNSSRILAVAGLNLAALLFVFVPAPFALRAQALLSKKPDLASRITVTPRPSTTNTVARAFVGGQEMTGIPLELVAEHLPPNVELRADDLVVSASWPDKPVTFTRQPGINRRSQENGQAIFDVAMVMSTAQFAARRTQPVTIRVSLYMTLFGDDEKSTISLRTPAALAQDGLRCEATRLTDHGRSVPPPPGSETEWHPADSITCVSLFQWPRKLVYAEAGEHRADFSNTRISYAPFPASFSLSPVEARWSDPVDSDEITIVTRRPLAHFHRDFELKGVKFADFEWSRFMSAPPHPSPRSEPGALIPPPVVHYRARVHADKDADQPVR